MKKVDLTKEIMRRVVKHERKKEYAALEVWFAMVLGFLSLMILMYLDLSNELRDIGALELLSMMINDFDIAKEFGQMLWETIAYELPWVKLVGLLIIMVVLIVVGYGFRKRIFMMRKKWEELKRYLEELDR